MEQERNSLDQTIAIPVSDNKSLTPYKFYEYFLPALKDCLQNKNKSVIDFDMTSVESVSPLVLPNLLIVGLILKKYYRGIASKIILSSQNRDVIRFLYYMRFFRLLDKHSFLTYNSNLVGGFTSKKTSDLGLILYLPISDLGPEEIGHQILSENRDITAFLKHFNDINLANTFYRTVSELAHNCMLHGRSDVFISVYGGPKMGLQCAISDCGVAYLASLLKNPEDLRVYKESELRADDERKDFRTIIEAVCRRSGKRTYGLSSVIKDIANVGGTTRIHSGNTQVVFTTQNQFEKYDDIKLADHLWSLAEKSNSTQLSPVRRRRSRLAGVHIEFEIPPTKKPKERRAV